ncbi:hypothetical protein Tco_1283745 [Tanacetum coccineum]
MGRVGLRVLVGCGVWVWGGVVVVLFSGMKDRGLGGVVWFYGGWDGVGWLGHRWVAWWVMVQRSQIAALSKPIDRLSSTSFLFLLSLERSVLTLKGPNDVMLCTHEYNALVEVKALVTYTNAARCYMVSLLCCSKHKFHADGTLSRYKARLVANGVVSTLGWTGPYTPMIVTTLVVPATEDSPAVPEQTTVEKLDSSKNVWQACRKASSRQPRTSFKHQNKNVDTTPRYMNDNQTGQFGNQRAVNVVGARETVGGPVVQQSGIQYQAEQLKSLADTDEEIDEQELEAHYSYMERSRRIRKSNPICDIQALFHKRYLDFQFTPRRDMIREGHDPYGIPAQVQALPTQKPPMHDYGAHVMYLASIAYAHALPQAFHTMALQNPRWNRDTGASSHLADNTGILTTLSNQSMYPSYWLAMANL